MALKDIVEPKIDEYIDWPVLLSLMHREERLLMRLYILTARRSIGNNNNKLEEFN